MVFHFMTKRNANGRRRYLAFNDELKIMTTKCPYVTPWSDAIEIKLCDLNRLAFELKENGYEVVEK